MRRIPGGRTAWFVAGGGALVVAIGAGIGAFGLINGWFDDASVEGSTVGFDIAAEPAAPPAAPEWPEYGFTPERTRANTGLKLSPPYRRLWRVDAGSLVEFPPVVAQGRAYVGTNGRRALAIDLRTGRVVWRARLHGAVASSPAATGPIGRARHRLLLVTMVKGGLIALDPATGRTLWRMSFGSPIESSPLVLGDQVYVGTLDGRVLRISLRTRRVVWTARATGAVKGSLARSGRNVVVGDYGGRVTAYRQDTGRVVWRTTSPGQRLRGAGRFYAGPTIAYGRVFIGNVNGRMLALSAARGSVAWVRVVDDFIYSSAAVAHRTVFVGSYDHHLYALDAVTGRVKWRHDGGERISGSPTVVGDIVWYSTIAPRAEDGRTFGLDLRTGRVVVRINEGRYTPAVAVKDTLLLTGVDTITALRSR
ncbi:MAG: PQQ-binding-like beta-propeller repeat protein [Thermoleophilia bacterium]